MPNLLRVQTSAGGVKRRGGRGGSSLLVAVHDKKAIQSGSGKTFNSHAQPITMPIVERNNVRFHYDTAGHQGSPVLLVMGYCVPGIGWMPQIPELSKTHRVGWFDHRGVGETSFSPGSFTIKDLAQDALAVMDALSFETAHVVGVSMGGMVAQELALSAPGRVRSLTLIATHSGGLGAACPTFRGVIQAIRVLFKGASNRSSTLRGLLFPSSFLTTCDSDWLDRSMERDFGVPVPYKARRRQFWAVVGHNTRPRIHQLEGIPTLIIKAGKDILVAPTESDRLHKKIPGSTMISMEDAGHGIIRQCADELNAALLDQFAAADWVIQQRSDSCSGG